jgi:hypothetical protein
MKAWIVGAAFAAASALLAPAQAAAQTRLVIAHHSAVEAHNTRAVERFKACAERERDGEVVHRLDLPARRPTCPTFGGGGLEILFVTSARFGLAAPGEADGALFAIEGTGASGLPEPCLSSPSGQPPRLPTPTEVP